MTVSTGIITTIAGTGTATYSGDNGQATSATLNYPEALTLDVSGKPFLCFIFSFLFPCSLQGNVYIADRYNHRIRKVTVSTGIITTIAGSGGTGSYSGDNGQAMSATLNGPQGVVVDSSGIVFFSTYFCYI